MPSNVHYPRHEPLAQHPPPASRGPSGCQCSLMRHAGHVQLPSHQQSACFGPLGWHSDITAHPNHSVLSTDMLRSICPPFPQHQQASNRASLESHRTRATLHWHNSGCSPIHERRPASLFCMRVSRYPRDDSTKLSAFVTIVRSQSKEASEALCQGAHIDPSKHVVCCRLLGMELADSSPP